MLYPIATISAMPCVLIVCHYSLHFWACRGCCCTLLGDLHVYTSWAPSTAGPWQLYLRPGAHFCLFFLLLGPLEMLLVRIRMLTYTTCSIYPFSAGNHIPQGRRLSASVKPCGSSLVRTGSRKWGALGSSGTKACQWGFCLLAEGQSSRNQCSGDHLQWCLTQA